MENPLFYFMFYGFTGWALESAFISVKYRRFINRGFLKGPFKPVYGFGALALLTGNLLGREKIHIILKTAFGAIGATAVEYAAGWFMENRFRQKLWDYSRKKYNLHGKICLEYSIYWLILAGLFYTVIHPAVQKLYLTIPFPRLRWLQTAFLVYLAVDLAWSVRVFTGVMKQLAMLKKGMIFKAASGKRSFLFSRRRFINAFPFLRKSIVDNMRKGLAPMVQEMFPHRPDGSIILPDRQESGETVYEREYYEIVRDILDNKEFRELRKYPHHGTTIHRHVKTISYLAYRICKNLGFDYRSAARGGLLHDFFLYDWRRQSGSSPKLSEKHGFTHPRIALENARRHFTLTPREEDIILKHMWPLTRYMPRFRESFVVNILDKLVSSGEIAVNLIPRTMQKRKPVT